MTHEPGSHAAFLARRHFAALDGLRALSIVPIIWHHSTPYPLPGLLGQGPAGVSLFFCISGFLITTLLLRERRELGKISLRAFYARRALRIFPLYYAVLLAYVAFAWLLPAGAPQRSHFFHALPYFASYTANWFVDYAVAHPVLFSFAWSLCVEEQFYALWPPLLAALGSRALCCAALFVLFALGTAPVAHALHACGASPVLLRIAASFSRPIGWGALLALALDEPRCFAALRAVLGRPASAPLSLLAVLAVLGLLGVPGSALDLSLVALVASAVIPERCGLGALLEHPASRYLGRISYGLYLLHMSAIGFLRRALPSLASSAPQLFALALPLSILLASGSYFAFERRFLALRARFRPSNS